MSFPLNMVPAPALAPSPYTVTLQRVITATRYHDISTGHRVFGHESKCAHMHGHNYRVHFTVALPERSVQVDMVGRVLDFSVIKERLCMWIEQQWDHRFLVFRDDPWAPTLTRLDPSVVVVPFNPTAENMAAHLLFIIGPAMLTDTAAQLVNVVIEETAKCSATASINVKDWSKL